MRRFTFLAIGVFASTGTTYLLFLAFSLHSTVYDLGIYGLATAIVAVIIRLVDGISGQRIFQEIERFVLLPKLGALNFHRFIIYFVIGSVIELLIRMIGIVGFDWLGFLIVGQGFYASIVGTRILVRHGSSLLVAQISNSFAFVCACVSITMFNLALNSSDMILINAMSLIVASIAFVFMDILDWVRGLKSGSSSVFRALYGSRQGSRQLGMLACYQAANALSGSVDSVVAGLGGLGDVARYQAVQRPLLGLATFNVAIGQFSMNRIAFGGGTVVRKLLLAFSPTLILWPIIGLLCVVILPYMMPVENIPNISIGLLVGLAYGIGALMQVTGTFMMHRNKSFQLLQATILQLGLMLALGYALVPAWGLVGLATSLSVSRAAGFGFHCLFMKRLLRSEFKVELQGLMK